METSDHDNELPFKTAEEARKYYTDSMKEKSKKIFDSVVESMKCELERSKHKVLTAISNGRTDIRFGSTLLSEDEHTLWIDCNCRVKITFIHGIWKGWTMKAIRQSEMENTDDNTGEYKFYRYNFYLESSF